jgi:hypothetical protein
MTRYLAGLCVAGLGLCGGGGLIVATVAFGGESAGLAGQVNLLTGVGLVVVSSVTLGCWATAWRRRMRVDGVLTARFVIATPREARQNRRELRKEVGRTARRAKRSARDARRAARRSARLAGGGGGGDVLSAGAGLGSAPGGDGPYSVAVPVVPAVPSREAAEAVTAHAAPSSKGAVFSKGTVSPKEAVSSKETGETGESAVELLSELRAMLMPLLTATGERPAANGTTLAAAPQAATRAASDAPDTPIGPDVPAAPGPAVPPLPLPRRTSAPRPTPRTVPLRTPPPVPPPAPPADDDDLMFAADGEEAWW